jgi:hypothetical protein
LKLRDFKNKRSLYIREWDMSPGHLVPEFIWHYLNAAGNFPYDPEKTTVRSSGSSGRSPVISRLISPWKMVLQSPFLPSQGPLHKVIHQLIERMGRKLELA